MQVGGLGCTFVARDVVQSAYGAMPQICRQRAWDTMRNRVAELGANAYVLLEESSVECLLGGTRLEFEAYRCPAP